MFSKFDKLATQLEALRELIDSLQERSIEELVSVATRDNLDEVLTTKLPKITEHRLLVDYSYDLCQNLYYIRIGSTVFRDPYDSAYEDEPTPSKNAEKTLTIARRIIKKVYPRVDECSPRDDSGIAVRGVYDFYLLSRSAYRSMHCCTQLAEEDRVDHVESYLGYVMKHKLPVLGEYTRGLRSHEWESHLAITWYDLLRKNPFEPHSSTNLPDAVVLKFRHWISEYRSSFWDNLHPRLLNLVLALAPLRLAPYEMLWLVDWIPGIHFTCYRKNTANVSEPYDANRVRKLRMIERVSESYERIPRERRPSDEEMEYIIAELAKP